MVLVRQKGPSSAKRKSALSSRLSGSFTLLARWTTWRSASRFATLPRQEERSWREIYCCNLGWVTSCTRSPANSAPERSSELQSPGPSPGILLFFSQMSRRLRWTRRREEIFVRFFEERLTNKEGPLLWSAMIRDGRNSLIAPSLSVMAGSKKRWLFYETIRGIGGNEGIQEFKAVQQMGHRRSCRCADCCGCGFARDFAKQEFRGGSRNIVRQLCFGSHIRLPGRVEGASETTQVGAAADGVLKAV